MKLNPIKWWISHQKKENQIRELEIENKLLENQIESEQLEKSKLKSEINQLKMLLDLEQHASRFR